MDKNQIKSLISENRAQLHGLANDILSLQEKIDEIKVKRQGVVGIIAALEFIESNTPEAVMPEAPVDEAIGLTA